MCIRCDRVFRRLSKMVVSHFYHKVKTRRVVAPHMLDPLYLNWHSIINNDDI